MKIRMNIVMLTLLAILAGLVWVVKNQKNTIKTLAAVPAAKVEAPQPPKVQALTVPATQPISAVLPVAPAVPALPVAAPSSTPEVAHTAGDSATQHIAQPGETVTSLATNLLGKDTKTNRDAIINANASLKADPDKLLAGNSYRIPSTAEVAESKAAAAIPAPAIPTPQPEVKEPVHAKPATELKYTAAPGDTVTKMAEAFLGSDNKAHQDAIINANSSLKADPDKVVAGKSYRIPAPDGLSAAAAPSPAATSPRPTTQPDADQVVLASSPRKLRYTARAGDTVNKLAIELLGSDTEESRNAIINNNPDLKRDPDRVIAGQTYWIPAPTAAVRNP